MATPEHDVPLSTRSTVIAVEKPAALGAWLALSARGQADNDEGGNDDEQASGVTALGLRRSSFRRSSNLS